MLRFICCPECKIQFSGLFSVAVFSFLVFRSVFRAISREFSIVFWQFSSFTVSFLVSPPFRGEERKLGGWNNV